MLKQYFKGLDIFQKFVQFSSVMLKNRLVENYNDTSVVITSVVADVTRYFCF